MLVTITSLTATSVSYTLAISRRRQCGQFGDMQSPFSAEIGDSVDRS